MELRLTEDEPGFVSVVTMVETVWALGSIYELSDHEIASAVERMLQADTLVIQNEQEVFTAAVALKAGHGSFTDALIGALGTWAGCASTLTFDRKALRLNLRAFYSFGDCFPPERPRRIRSIARRWYPAVWVQAPQSVRCLARRRIAGFTTFSEMGRDLLGESSRTIALSLLSTDSVPYSSSACQRLIWNCVREGKLGIGYHLARAAERSFDNSRAGVPSILLRMLVASVHVTSSSGPMIEHGILQTSSPDSSRRSRWSDSGAIVDFRSEVDSADSSSASAPPFRHASSRSRSHSSRHGSHAADATTRANRRLSHNSTSRLLSLWNLQPLATPDTFHSVLADLPT
jgi:predicted nucleic-acid-binding protein